MFIIFEVFQTFLTSPVSFSHHFNSDWCQKQVQRRSGGQFLTRTSGLWTPHCLSGSHIVSPEATLSLPKTHCLSWRNTVSPEDTFFLPKTHCVSGRYILARSIARSLDRSSLARSLGSQSPLHKVLCAKYLAQSTLRKVLCAKDFAQSTLRKVLSAKYFAQSIFRKLLCEKYVARSTLRKVRCAKCFA